MTTPPIISPLMLAQSKAIGAAPLPSSMVMPGSLPAIDAPVMPTVTKTPTQTDVDQAHRNQLINSGDGISQIHNPLLRGVARAADIAGTVFAPGLAMAIPGTMLHHNMLVNQATKNLAADQAADKATADTGELTARADQAEAQAGNLAAQTVLHTNQAESDKPFDVSPEMANAAGVPELAGQRVSQQTYQKLFGGTQATGTKKIIADDQNATRVETTGMNNDTSRANNKDTNATHETVAAAADKTRVLLGQMHDATSRANNENTNDHKVGSEGNYKVPADVTKRAALASNVLENATAVTSILGQHPEIVGATGGRYSNVQQMIGSNDPNIQALGVRIHNIALASNGAHGVRSQEAVRDTENELFNHFKAGPQAIQSGLNALTSSVQTFLDDEKNFSTTGRRAGGDSSQKAAPGPKVGDVVDGYRFNGGNAGDQKNWVKQ